MRAINAQLYRRLITVCHIDKLSLIIIHLCDVIIFITSISTSSSLNPVDICVSKCESWTMLFIHFHINSLIYGLSIWQDNLLRWTVIYMVVLLHETLNHWHMYICCGRRHTAKLTLSHSFCIYHLSLLTHSSAHSICNRIRKRIIIKGWQCDEDVSCLSTPTEFQHILGWILRIASIEWWPFLKVFHSELSIISRSASWTEGNGSSQKDNAKEMK